MISAKYEEIYPPSVKVYAKAMGDSYSVPEIL